MRKEVVLAIIAGGLLGLVIAYGVWRANIALSSKSKSPTTNEVKNPSATPTNQELKVVLAKPNNQEVIIQSPVTISGVTQSKATLLISGEDNDTIEIASSSGSFDIPVSLTGGINNIKIFAFDEAENQTSANLLLVYSTSFFKGSSTNIENATSSASDIQNKVQQKVKEALSLGTSYIGIVTDISDSAIQIKTNKGEIQQVSPNKDDITYIKSTDDTTKEIRGADLAIGDFIVAMGIKNGLPAQAGNNVLHASRILVTNPIKENKIMAVIGAITDSSKFKEISVKDLNIIPDDNITISNDSSIKSKITRFSGLENGDKIIAVGTKDSKGNLVARTIRVLDIPTSTPTPKPSPKG